MFTCAGSNWKTEDNLALAVCQWYFYIHTEGACWVFAGGDAEKPTWFHCRMSLANLNVCSVKSDIKAGLFTHIPRAQLIWPGSYIHRSVRQRSQTPISPHWSNRIGDELRWLHLHVAGQSHLFWWKCTIILSTFFSLLWLERKHPACSQRETWKPG